MKSLDNRLDFFADQELISLRDNGFLSEDKSFKALLLDLFRYLIFELGRVGLFFKREFKDTDIVERMLLNELNEFLKFSFSLSGEAHHETRSDDNARHLFAELFDNANDLGSGGFAMHGLENAIIDVLDRHVEIGTNPGV